MFVTNVFNFATEGKCYRYGSINMPINMWGPWHTATHKAEGGLADVKISIEDMITPEKVMDIFQFFTMFATDKKYRKYKIICRYQQFEGANMIVDRVVAGYPKKGLIWHFQGSGKSLLMVFAAQKLRMIPELKNPTVVIVDDRIDLETQITATFNASDIPNLTSAATKEELLSFFRGDMRKILITTIFKFGEVSGELNARDNIIVMVDEAHRTQEGDLGEKMRMALPNAFFFGLTGTPINRVDKNTFATFGAEEDRTGYMSRYSFSDSIRDGATLPLHFEPVPVELHVDKDKLDREFDAMTDEAGLSRDEKNELSRRVNMKAIMYNPARIRKVCEHIAKHFKEKIEPNGYKGQVVVYDRECCLMYKAVLDELLGEDATTIVMDTNNDKEDRYKKYRRDRDQESKDFKVTQGDTLRSPNYLERGSLQTFDCVVANPPFSLKNWGSEQFSSDIYGRNIWGCPTDSNGDFAWLQHMVKSMNPKTGRCAVVLPQGVLFRSGKEGEIRRQLVESDKLEAIITMASGVFYSTGVSACILFLNNNKVVSHRGRICMIDGSGIYTPQRAQNIMTEADIQTVFDYYTAYEDVIEKVKIVTIADIREKDYSLAINNYIEKKEQETVPPEEIRRQYFEAYDEMIETETRMRELLLKGGYVSE